MPVTLSETPAWDLAITAPASGDPRTAASVRTAPGQLASRTRFLLWAVAALGGRFAPAANGVPIAVSAVNLASGVFTLAGHGLSTADPVRLVIGPSGGTLPAETPEGVILYAVNVGTDSLGFALTSGGAQLASLTGSFTGEVYVIRVADPDIYLPTVGTVTAGKLSAVLARYGRLAANNVWSGVNAFSHASFSGIVQHTNAITRVGPNARVIKREPVAVPDADTTIDLSMGDVFLLAAPTAGRTLYLREGSSPAPAPGESLRVIRQNVGAFPWTIRREGGSAAMVTLPGSTHASAVFETKDDATWTLAGALNGTVGADAW